jgi:predicted GNAT superfamily acetyltransferase
MEKAGVNSQAVLELNAQNVIETSALDEAALERLVAQAFHVGLVGSGADAFLIALDETADYESANFAWFASRYDRFVYIDRVVTAEAARGRGLARALYCELFDKARAAGRTVIGCEVNLDPPNPGSDAFHAKLGFVEVGRQTLVSGKTVRYLVKEP